MRALKLEDISLHCAWSTLLCTLSSYSDLAIFWLGGEESLKTHPTGVCYCRLPILNFLAPSVTIWICCLGQWLIKFNLIWHRISGYFFSWIVIKTFWGVSVIAVINRECISTYLANSEWLLKMGIFQSLYQKGFNKSNSHTVYMFRHAKTVRVYTKWIDFQSTR